MCIYIYTYIYIYIYTQLYIYIYIFIYKEDPKSYFACDPDGRITQATLYYDCIMKQATIRYSDYETGDYNYTCIKKHVL